MESLADEELVRLYRAGRRADVFTEMIRRHQPMVTRTCLRLAGNMHDAEDAAQSVFLALAQRPEVVRRSLAGCLHGLARAAVSELRRSRRRRQEREEIAAGISSLFARLRGRSHPLEHQELREEIDVALAQLPDMLQQAVILRYLEGHSQEEAARQAGCTQTTMGWRSMKGLERLRTILARRGAGVLAGATLLAVLEAEARAAGSLAPPAALTGATTATAGRLAATLVRHSVLGNVVRKVAVVAVLATAALALGAGFLLLPQLEKPAPATGAPAPPVASSTPRPAPALGVFDRSLDIGGPARAGSAQLSADTYTVQGGGSHIYGEKDQFRFVCRPWEGDGEISARVTSDPDQEARQVAAGVMFRERLTADSKHMAVLVTSVESHVKYRTADNPGSACDIARLDTPGKNWVRLVRRRNMIAAFVRPDGSETWKLLKELELPLDRSLFVGLAVTAHDDAQLATVTFDHVSVRSRPER
jgi:RNA polymerase sigma factor (sigma-70 family)